MATTGSDGASVGRLAERVNPRVDVCTPAHAARSASLRTGVKDVVTSLVQTLGLRIPSRRACHRLLRARLRDRYAQQRRHGPDDAEPHDVRFPCLVPLIAPAPSPAGTEPQ